LRKERQRDAGVITMLKTTSHGFAKTGFTRASLVLLVLAASAGCSGSADPSSVGSASLPDVTAADVSAVDEEPVEFRAAPEVLILDTQLFADDSVYDQFFASGTDSSPDLGASAAPLASDGLQLASIPLGAPTLLFERTFTFVVRGVTYVTYELVTKITPGGYHAAQVAVVRKTQELAGRTVAQAVADMQAPGAISLDFAPLFRLAGEVINYLPRGPVMIVSATALFYLAVYAGRTAAAVAEERFKVPSYADVAQKRQDAIALLTCNEAWQKLPGDGTIKAFTVDDLLKALPTWGSGFIGLWQNQAALASSKKGGIMAAGGVRVNLGVQLCSGVGNCSFATRGDLCL
jgi:hypothetical protein